MPVPRIQATCLIASFAFLLPGCAADDNGMVSVSGHVTWEGNPVTTGSVTFTPAAADAAGKTRLATGQIQSDGTFTMTTLKQGDGVLPGAYRVAVNADPPPPMEILDGQQPPRGPIPAKYADPSTSGLEITVQPGADALTHDFALPN